MRRLRRRFPSVSYRPVFIVYHGPLSLFLRPSGIISAIRGDKIIIWKLGAGFITSMAMILAAILPLIHIRNYLSAFPERIFERLYA